MKKFVVWFHNHTSNKDDEWTTVHAKNEEEAIEKALPKMNRSRFSLGRCYPIKEFRKIFGRDWPL